MKFILVALMLTALTGCGGRYVHPSANQSQVNRMDFDCRYKAEMMSKTYQSPIISGLDWVENFDRCMRSYGFYRVSK